MNDKQLTNNNMVLKSRLKMRDIGAVRDTGNLPLSGFLLSISVFRLETIRSKAPKVYF